MLTVGSLFAGIEGFGEGFRREGFRVVWNCEIDPDCRRVLAHHFPDTPCYEDVRQCGAANLEPVDVICGGFPCFPAGTFILTRSGYEPIESIAVGTEVYTHAGRWMPVTSTMSREAGETLTLKGGFHYGLTTTPEHPFWASGGRHRKYKPQAERCRGNWHDLELLPPQWVEAKNMEGQYWSTPVFDGNDEPPLINSVRQVTGQGFVSSYGVITPDLMWIVGAWVGDGWTRRRKDRSGNLSAIIICCPDDETPVLLGRFIAAGLHATVSKDRTVNKLIVSHRAVAEWIVQHFGELCDGKRIPAWLYTCKRELRQAFLSGYIWADGSFDETGNWRTTTINRRLAVGVATLGNALDWACSMYHAPMKPTCIIEGRECNQQDQYFVYGRSFRKQTSAFRINDHVFSKCRSVTTTGPARVFNLSVAEDESYIADGIVVHNCQGLSVAGKRGGLTDVRSGMFFEMARIVRELRPSLLVWENVPGLLSGKDEESACECDTPDTTGETVCGTCGRCVGEPASGPVPWMGTVLRELSDSGLVGAWRVVSSEFYGVPQRRRRVFGCFACLDPRNRIRLPGAASWGDPLRLARLCAEILALTDRSTRHPAKGRKKEKDVAAPLTRGSATGSGVNAPGRRREDDVNLVIAPCLRSNQWNNSDAGMEAQMLVTEPMSFDPRNVTSQANRTRVKPGLPANTLHQDGLFVVTQDSTPIVSDGIVPTLRVGTGLDIQSAPAVVYQASGAASERSGSATCAASDDNGSNQVVVTHTLRSEGFDASEDGTGRGTPIVVTPIDMRQASRDETMTNNRKPGSSGGAPGTGIGEVGEPSPSLADSHTPAVAFTQRTRADGANVECSDNLAFTLDAPKDGGRKKGGVVHGTVVRRLTPVECLRLQGFEDTWLDLDPPLSDSAKYRMCGNAVTLNVGRWLARRMRRILESAGEPADVPQAVVI